MTPDTIQSRFKTALPIEWTKDVNVPLWAFCKALAQDIRTDTANAVRDAVLDVEARYKAEALTSKASTKRMTDEELADAIDVMICNKVLDETISAAEIAQLKDIRNIKLKDRDVVINVLNYKDLP
jgi:hypothetical protein